MKINKKVVVATLSTALGLGIVGSISGTVAWYQYATKGMVSIVGNNVSEGGVLQISTDHANWKKDLYTDDVKGSYDMKFYPVTFGESVKDDVLPAQAYQNPIYGIPDMSSWKTATANTHYLQYDIYLRAEKYNASGELEAFDAPVYISDMKIEDAAVNKPVAKAVRVHINVDGGSKFLIAKDVNEIDTHGKLDLDKNGQNDPELGYQWNNPSDEVDYGKQATPVNEDKLSSYTIADLKATRDAEGNLSGGTKICDTSSTYVKLTITVWLEGWQKLGEPASAIWDYAQQGGAQFRLGITFDVGKGAFSA